jgi:8-oxo-dGTP diphosphatase
VYLARPVLKLRPPSEPHHQGLLLPPGQAARQLGNAGDRMFLQHYLRRQG